MITYIFDELDKRLKSFIDKTGAVPTTLELDPYAYMELKMELGYEDDIDKEVRTWNGFTVLVNINAEEYTMRFLRGE
jgi:hypothetical protein